ncbi:hypothetical protein D3C80_1727170 [compost metagenome]
MRDERAFHVDPAISLDQQLVCRQHFFDAQADATLNFTDAGHTPKGVQVFLICQHDPLAGSVKRLICLHDGTGEKTLDGLFLNVRKGDTGETVARQAICGLDSNAVESRSLDRFKGRVLSGWVAFQLL